MDILFLGIFYALTLPQYSQDGSNGDSLPLGTIIAYNGPLSAIPVGWHLCDGSDGTPDLRGRFLDGSDTPGIFLEAALPNLVGNAWYVPHGGYYEIYGNGVFEISRSGSYGNATSGGHTHNINFDASRYNSIYKDDCDTVQPPAFTVYYIMKIR